MSVFKPVLALLQQILAALRLPTALVVFLFFLPTIGNADFLLVIQEVPRTRDFTITASGSHIMQNSVPLQETAFLRVPGSTEWINPLGLTTIFGNVINGNRNGDYVSISGSNDVSVSGSVSYFRQHTGLRVANAPASDRFALTTESSLLPALQVGDVVTFSGTTQFTLPGSLTFNDFWHDGVYNVTPAPNGGSYTVIVQAVPEPSAIALLSFAGLGLCVRRWRTQEVSRSC